MSFLGPEFEMQKSQNNQHAEQRESFHQNIPVWNAENSDHGFFSLFWTY